MRKVILYLIFLGSFLTCLYPNQDPFIGEGLYFLLTNNDEEKIIKGKYYVLGFWQGFLKAEKLALKNESLRANLNFKASENFYNNNRLVPNHIKSKQILEIVIKYLEKNPQLRKKDSPTLIFEAIYNRFN